MAKFSFNAKKLECELNKHIKKSIDNERNRGNSFMFTKLPTQLKRALKEAIKNVEGQDYFNANKCLSEDGSPIKDHMFTELERLGYIRTVADGGLYRLEAPAFIYDEYEAEYDKRNTPATSITTGNIHINGGSRLNLNSVDNSVNITLTKNDESLFESIFKTLDESSIEEKDNIKSTITDMKQSVGKPSFSEKYNAFIQSVANHMTIFAPFIAPLTALLSQKPTP